MVKKTALTAVENKIPDVSGLATKSALTADENKIPDGSGLVKKTDFKTKITEVEGKIPSISGLATNSALTIVENKIPNVTSLVTKTDFDAKLKAISDRDTKNKSKDLILDNELKKLKAFDLSYFKGKNYFEESSTLIYLILQPIDKCFKRIVGAANGEFISFWKSRCFSDEKINSVTASNHMIAPSLDYLGAKIRVIFSGISKNYNISSYPTLENCLFGAVSLTKNADIDQYKYSGYDIRFDRLGGSSFGRNVIIFGADMSSSVHANNKKNNIVVLGKDFIQGINDTAIYSEKIYSINFTENNKSLF